MSELATATYVLTIAVALLYARRRGLQGLLTATVFLIPWFALMKDVGVTLNADRIVSAVLVVALVLKFGSRGMSDFAPFILYFVTVTVVLSTTLPASVADFAPTKGQWRWLFQLPMWTILIAPGAALAILGTRGAIQVVLRALLLSGTILGAMGIVQFLVFYGTGVDLFPLDFFAGGEGRGHGAFLREGFLGGTVFRASALAGEPKHLAYTLSTCLMVLAVDRGFGGLLNIGRKSFAISSVVCLVGLVLTFSTQGFVLLAVNLAVLLAATALLKGVSRAPFVLIGTALAALVAIQSIPGLSDVLYYRTIDRLADNGVVEDWNEAVWEWYRVSPYAWPLGVGLGNVHLYAADFIPQEFLWFMRGNVFVAKAGILRIASELGTVGLMIFAATALRPVVQLWKLARSGSRLAASAGTCASAAVVDFLISNDGPTYVYLFIGLAAAAVKVAARGSATVETRVNGPTATSAR